MTPLEKIAIVLIALAVVIIGAVIIYGRSLVRTDRERKELHRRRVEDFDREEIFKADATDPPYIGFLWNKKHFQLYKKGMLTLGEAINQTRADAGYAPLKFENGEDTKFFMDDDDTTKTRPGPEATA